MRTLFSVSSNIYETKTQAMHVLRALLISSFIGATVSLLACTPAPARCNVSNCSGCCNASGQCVAGTSAASCGRNAAVCTSCASNQGCSLGVCGPGGNTATGGGSGTAGGSAGGSAGGTAGGSAGGNAGGTAGGSAGGNAGGSAGGNAGGSAGGNTGGSGNSAVSLQLAAIRSKIDSIDAGVINLPIEGALVTAIKPLVANASVADSTGFFLQGEQAGPAVFVSVDPTSLAGGLAVGDNITLTAGTGARVSGARHITSVSNATISSRTNPIGPLRSDITQVDFSSASNLEAYESRLTSLNPVTVFNEPASAGTANSYKSVILTSTGNPSTTGALRLRLSGPDMDSLFLGPACTLNIDTSPLWRFGNQAQQSTWTLSDITVVSCPAPSPVSASAASPTSAVVVFQRDLKASSVSAAAFTVTGLTVTAATLTGPRQVTLTTSTQTSLTNYPVVVDATVQDMRNTSVDAAMNSTSFSGFVAGTCMPQVVISQIYGGGGNSGAVYNTKFVELHNRTTAPANLAGHTLQYGSSGGSTWSTAVLSGMIAPGGYFLVQVGSGTNGAMLPVMPDLTVSGVTPAAAAGKMALVNGTNALSGMCPTNGFVDLVGFGTAANCSETMPSPAPSATLSVIRSGAGAQASCVDSNNNSADFTAAAPSPRNAMSTANTCMCP